jgi:uncharacterized membrane protein YphA (DoxX/SURF4 family)
MVESILLQLPLRVLLGGVFLYAAYNKIPAIQSFAEAIKGFQVLDSETHGGLIVMAAFVIPWFELIAGLMLVIGLRGRSAALGIGLLLAMFIYALLHVIFTDVSADCSCFGDQNMICGSTVGWCQVIRNAVLLLPSIYLLWRGPGRVSLDQVLSKPDQTPSEPQKGAQTISYDVDADASRA